MESTEQIRRLLLQHLDSLQAGGVQTVPRGTGQIVLPERSVESPQPSVEPNSSQANPVVSPTSAAHATPNAPNVTGYGDPIEREQRQSTLEVVQNEVAHCQACPELCKSRKNTVFGVGNPNARLCFVGEGPGADEDRLGEPFVGAAGQLLNKILGACKLKREDVYILNTVKCRPPGNRNPTEDELGNCWPYGLRQLEIIQPEFICCLGSVAAKTVLGTKSSISRLRGQFHDFRGSKVVVTYHPAYLLRTPTAKKHTWNDMKMLMAEMGIEV